MKIFKISLCVLLSALTLSGSVLFGGINSFAALPEIEIMDIDISNPFDYEHYVNEDEEEGSEGKIKIIPNDEKRTKAVDLPSSYDSRDYGYVSSVKSQGKTGTCWAHAAMSAIESYELLYKGETAKNIDLAESHLVWFSHNPNSGGANKAQDGQNLGTGAYTYGGNWMYAALAFANHEGINRDSDYPLKGDLSDMAYSETDRFSQTAGIAAEDVTLISGADNIKMAIMNNGSVTCSIHYDNAYLTKKYSVSNIFASYYCPDSKQINHSVTLVGWDDSYSKNNFGSSVPADNGAWIAKNSYGNAWGNNGYFMISYEDAGLSQAASWSVMDTGEFINNYSHTSALFASVIPNYNTYASVYTAEGYETIDNVGIFNMTDNAAVTVSVYRNLSPTGDPESGSFAGSQSRYLEKEGYYTFYFGSIPLNPGERFAVVVSISCSGKVKIPVETASIGNFTCNANESYLKTGNGWFDLTENESTKFGNTYVFVNTKCRHNYETREIPATCVSTGKIEICCAYCGRIESETVIPAAGHRFKTVSSSTGGSNKITYTEICEICGAAQSESYIRGTRTITFIELIQRIFEMIFGRFRGVKVGDKY